MTKTKSVNALPTGRNVVVPLNQLQVSELNVRKTYDPASLPELAALLEAQGQLQQLCVTQPADGGYLVEAGGRRLRAFWLLRDQGKIAADHPIECKVYDTARAVELSLAENSGRVNMHPADEFEAFQKLAEQGLTEAQIAGRFGVSVLTVQRRLSLAKVAPMFIELYRADKISADQLKALSVTPDHGKQIAAWGDSPYHRSPYHLKERLTQAEVAGDSKLVRFVGLDAYKAAGGTVRQDLFSDDDECWLQDPALLSTLADKALQEAVEVVRGEGWLWVEASAGELGYSDLSRFGRERSKARAMTPEEAECIEEWKALRDDACSVRLEYENQIEQANDTDDGSVADTGELEALHDDADTAFDNINEMLGLLHESLAQWSRKQLATCGAMVCVNHSGELEVRRGLMRPEDVKAAARQEIAKLKEAGKPVPASMEKQGGERGEFSEKLMLDMTAHRTAALQAALVGNAHAALALVVHGLAVPIFLTHRYHVGPLRVTATLTRNTPLAQRASEYDASPAAVALSEMQGHWGDVVPGGTPEQLYRWLLEQDTATLLDLLAFCAASSLDAMHAREKAEFGMSDALADALDLDMADWWTPTPGKFLASVSKAALIKTVAEATGEDASKAMGAMKKAEAIAYADAKLQGTRWLPVPLRRVVRDLEDEARDEAEALDDADAADES